MPERPRLLAYRAAVADLSDEAKTKAWDEVHECLTQFEVDGSRRCIHFMDSDCEFLIRAIHGQEQKCDVRDGQVGSIGFDVGAEIRGGVRFKTRYKSLIC